MDILDEIDEEIKNRKKEWDYTPKREKSETDALIDELLKEFSTENKPGEPYRRTPSYSSEYDSRSEIDERREYESAETYRPEMTASEEPTYESRPESYVKQEPLKRRAPEIYDQDIETPAPPPYNDSRQDSGGGSGDNYDDNGDDDNDDNDGGEDDYDEGLFDDDYYDEDDYNREVSGIDDSSKVGGEFDDYVSSEERVRIIQPKQKRGMVRIIWRIFYTAIIAAFTIIGIFSSVIYCLEQIDKLPSDIKAEEEAKKKEICDVLVPFVLTNMDDFESMDNISQRQLINLGIWEVAVHGDPAIYDDETTDGYVIPHSQIQYVCSKLLGYEKIIEPVSINFANFDIRYDAEKGGYILPRNHDVFTLYPEVTNVKEDGDTYTVYVNCLRDVPSWYTKKLAPNRTVIFTMKKTSDYYKVLSAKTVI